MKGNDPEFAKESFSRKVLKGSTYLVLRRAVSVVLGFVGTLFLTRIVGPQGYGVFASAFGVFRFLSFVSDLGAQAYILRSPLETSTQIYRVGLWWTIVSSIVATVFGIIFLIFWGYFSLDDIESLIVFVVVVANVPLNQIAQIALIYMERNFDYEKIAKIEIISQIIYYLTGVVLAYGHSGVWAFVGAFWASQVVQSLGYLWLSRIDFSPKYDKDMLTSILKNSIKMGISLWIYELRLLLPALVLLPWAGERAVGHYSLATRLVNSLGFIRDAVWRVSVPIFAKFHNNTPQLIQSAQVSSIVQIVSQSFAFFIIILLGDSVLPLILGKQWNINEIIFVFIIWAICMNLFVIYETKKQILFVKNIYKLSILSSTFYISSSYLFSFLTSRFIGNNQLEIFVLIVTASYIPYFLVLHLGFRRFVGNLEPEPLVTLNILFASLFLSHLLGAWVLLANAILIIPRFIVKTIESIIKITKFFS
ncbi:MAG: hypothetical protein KatS3mg016_1435 [Fimbriimonadales bacterium]|nr:MAG: hypothetical protein KatS3mg016_1435 [Fimbriimonadales bacterium]